MISLVLLFGVVGVLTILHFSNKIDNNPTMQPTTTTSKPIIGFDWMKLSRDTVANQPSKALFSNILDLVQKNFPGTTHIAISTPEDANADFVAHGTTPKPLAVEAFIDMQLDVIHAHNYNAVLRNFPSSTQQAYNFPLQPKTSDQWVAFNKAFLEAHVSHIKDGDIIALWYEADGWQHTYGVSVNDTGAAKADYNAFWQKNAAMVAAFAKEHNFTNLRCRTTVNYSNAINEYMNPTSVAAQGAIVVDDYADLSRNITLNLSDSQLIVEFTKQMNDIYNLYGGKYKVYEQEIGDIRHSADGSDGGIQTTDPEFTGELADQVFFPLIKSGIMEGVTFWNLFSTPKEGILMINGDTATLNPKGQYLSTIFKKWYGTVLPPTPPTPTTITVSGTLTTDPTTGEIVIDLKKTQ